MSWPRGVFAATAAAAAAAVAVGGNGAPVHGTGALGGVRVVIAGGDGAPAPGTGALGGVRDAIAPPTGGLPVRPPALAGLAPRAVLGAGNVPRASPDGAGSPRAAAAFAAAVAPGGTAFGINLAVKDPPLEEGAGAGAEAMCGTLALALPGLPPSCINAGIDAAIMVAAWTERSLS